MAVKWSDDLSRAEVFAYHGVPGIGFVAMGRAF